MESKSTSGNISFGQPKDTYEYSAPIEVVSMNKYHLLWVLERLGQKPKWPKLEHVLIPLALFIGTLLTLLPADFQDYLGVKAAIWEAITLLIVWLSAACTVILFIWWLGCSIKFKKQSTLEILSEILDQMADDNKRLAKNSNQQQETDTGDSGS